jgi:PAS domain-containing protein
MKKDLDGNPLPLVAAVEQAHGAVVITDAEGRIQYLIAIKQDITERKRAEEALRESQGRLRDAENQLTWGQQESRGPAGARFGCHHHAVPGG